MSLSNEALAVVMIVAAEGDHNTSPSMIDRLIQRGADVKIVASNHRLTEGAGPDTLAKSIIDLRRRASGA